MSPRIVSRLATTGLVAGALSVAVSVPALARPGVDPPPGEGSIAAQHAASANITAGTDVAAPDQQNPVPAAEKPVPAPPPTWPSNPQPLTLPQNASASTDSGFQWDDAGIGAGGALVVVLTGLGAFAIVRRRHAPDGALTA